MRCDYVQQLRTWHSTVHEKATTSVRTNRRLPAGGFQASIEDELYHLRLIMEKIYAGEKSFTSPRVVEASMRLDTKIVEYMIRAKQAYQSSSKAHQNHREAHQGSYGKVQTDIPNP